MPQCAAAYRRRRSAIYNCSVDHHAVAAVSITGISVDVLGGLYLAYDLWLLTRMVTYLSCSESATASDSAFSLAWLPEPRPVLPSRLNFDESLLSFNIFMKYYRRCDEQSGMEMWCRVGQ